MNDFDEIAKLTLSDARNDSRHRIVNAIPTVIWSHAWNGVLIKLIDNFRRPVQKLARNEIELYNEL